MARRSFLLVALAILGLGAISMAQVNQVNPLGNAPGYNLTVNVLDISTGKPLPGVVVACRFNAFLLLQVSDANGQCTFLVSAGAYTIIDSAAQGYTSAGSEAFNMPSYDITDDLYGSFD